MGFLAFTLIVCLCASHDFVRCENLTVTVALGDSVTLNCTYNCSSGFVRGYWITENEHERRWSQERSDKDNFCTVFLLLQNVSSNDLKRYSCNTEVSDSTPIQPKTKLVVLLKLKDHTSHAITHKTETSLVSLQSGSNTSNATDTKEKSGMNDGIKVLAAVTITVALVLAALAVYLCLTRRRQGCNGKEHQPPVNSSKASSPTLPLNNDLSSKQSERVILRIPTPEIEGDPEVPYADIVISVRGASTPDISQALYLNSADRNEWWGVHPRTHLQAARSADMLHVPQPREVSRKMSTNSEYAVITYA